MSVRWERVAIFLIIAMALAVFLIPAFHVPQALLQARPASIAAPGAGASFSAEIGYMAVSGLLAGISPLFLLASLCLGVLLFIYNKSKIPRYARYYLIGAFAIFFAFEYQMSLPGGMEQGILGFQVIMFMAIASILLALIAQELSPGFAARAARNESVKVTYFMFLGALVALAILLYGGGASAPAIAYAAANGNSLASLLVYNAFVLLPSALGFALLSANRITLRTRLANNKESILLIGTITLIIAVLVLEIISILGG
jgi:hypothetical protein